MSNISRARGTQAYVSGMKEDLNIQGNQYTYMLMCYTIAFAVMQVPSNVIVLKVRPRICIVEEKQIALRRSATQGNAQGNGKLDKALAKRMFGSWRWWVLCLTYVMHGQVCQGASYFAIYLRASGYSVTARNVIPGCANLVSMITDFSYSFESDYTSNRVWWMVIAIMCTTVVGSSVLTAWPAVDAARVVVFFLLSSGFVTGITWTWANETHVGSAEECALTISSMNGLLYATGSFMPILIFPQTMAPKFERGFPSLVGFGVAACSLMLFTDFMHKRQLHLEAEQSDSAVPQSV
ncbi:hypothetical protein FCULG_00005846, partial [Fusarium culmorum]